MVKKAPQRGRAKPPLPKVGDAFLMPLADRRFGVCRVIKEGTVEDKLGGVGWVLAVASSWIGANPPSLSARGLRSILKLNHHSWQNEPQVVWVSGPPPAAFHRLGCRIMPSAKERGMDGTGWSSWENFPLQVLLQWRWEHDREALLAEEAKAEEAKAEENERLVHERQKYLSRLTLAKLRRVAPFRAWVGYYSADVIRAARRVFRDTIDHLAALGPKPNKKAARAVLKACIERFNELDEEHDRFIDTVAREDICDHFYEIVHVVGLGKYGESKLADKWREW